MDSYNIQNVVYMGTLESEASQNQNNVGVHNLLLQSPQSKYYDESRYMQRRRKEELLHEDWIKQRHDLEKKFQAKMEEGMTVQSGDNRVKFVYQCKGHRALGLSVFRFKIILTYRSLLRRWYISPGYSFVPKAIDLRGKLKSGTYHPFSKKVLDVIRNVRRSIDVFMTRLSTVYQFIYNAQERYKDVQFAMNAIITRMKLTFTENALPSDMQRCIKDMIIVKLKLNKDIQVSEITYEYLYQKTVARKDVKENLNKLRSKLQVFFSFSLEEALERFIEEEERNINSEEQESSE
ncbi:uncharacterized protein LOC112552498 [Pogonomyrmex barbatus]|uniref:Uncharacterized protein LOC112552498 n=1 Tax=Pogonomyrmex barbatus TaxID=144034 RepID=A0A8N1S460_9HYME|nr:uncharacterized protein LOC112552498 [Pogonomyrmex barbatus]